MFFFSYLYNFVYLVGSYDPIYDFTIHTFFIPQQPLVRIPILTTMIGLAREDSGLYLLMEALGTSSIESTSTVFAVIICSFPP